VGTPEATALAMLTAALTPGQVYLLESMAEETGLAGADWTAAGPLLTMAETWAVQARQRELRAQRPGWSERRCFSEAELEIRGEGKREGMPHAVYARLAIWHGNTRTE
jgi:hypothetical protein